MKISEIRDALALRVLAEGEPDREISGGYSGDLLSFVMGRCPADSIWITIMNNINVLAVASLADAAGVILAEDTEPDEAILAKARAEGLNLYTSPMTAFELCGRIYALLK